MNLAQGMTHDAMLLHEMRELSEAIDRRMCDIDANLEDVARILAGTLLTLDHNVAEAFPAWQPFAWIGTIVELLTAAALLHQGTNTKGDRSCDE